MRKVKPYAIYHRARKLVDRHGSAAAALEAIGNAGPTAATLRFMVEAERAAREIHELEQARQDTRNATELSNIQHEIAGWRGVLRECNAQVSRLLA